MKLPSVYLVDALRTPFVKSFGVFERETPLSLSVRVATEVIARSGINPHDIAEVVWGAVIPQIKNPNVARDLVLFSGLSNNVPGYTLNRACASSLQSLQCGMDAIRLGRADVVLAGGVEVLSDVPVTFSDDARRFFMKVGKARSLGERLGLLKEFHLRFFAPNTPAVAEPFSGLTMGQHAEIMAVKNNITRQRQDAFAVASHQKAAQAAQAGHFRDEIVPFWTGKDKAVAIESDNLVRPDTTLEGLAQLKPAFDKRYGTLTAGNSSALTDGASAALIASEAYVKKHRLKPLGQVIDTLTVAVDPMDQLLIAPAYAIPLLLQKHGLTLNDVGVYEIHEAFAAQVLSCLDKMADAKFCAEKLNMKSAFGVIPPDKLNLDGGSLAIGHPFGATGTRLAGRALRVAKRTGSEYAVIGICAAGGMGQAMLLKVSE